MLAEQTRRRKVGELNVYILTVLRPIVELRPNRSVRVDCATFAVYCRSRDGPGVVDK